MQLEHNLLLELNIVPKDV